jgi:GMP synthase-like glutamine amidotransferase
LGATVGKNPVWEIGWGEVQVEDNPVARQWLGELTSFDSFHWHGETFSLPAGAAKLLSSPHCANQAFALGPHLGLQCHVEMTADMVNSWCDSGEDDIAAHPGPAVQQVQEMRRNLRSRVTALNRVGRKLYRYWIKGLAR